MNFLAANQLSAYNAKLFLGRCQGSAVARDPRVFYNLRMNSKQSIILLSGGLDSAVSLYLALKEGYSFQLALNFDYGQRSAARENEAARKLASALKIPFQPIPLPWLKEITRTALVNPEEELPTLKREELDQMKTSSASAQKVWVPNRNGLFINIAAAYAESLDCGWIVTGFNKEEAATFPDNSPAFIEAINGSLSFSTLNHARVISPVKELEKPGIARKALELGVPLENLWSCYRGEKVFCGRCESCQRFIRAFEACEARDKISRLF